MLAIENGKIFSFGTAFLGYSEEGHKGHLPNHMGLLAVPKPRKSNMKPNYFEILFTNGTRRSTKAVLFIERHTSRFVHDYLSECLKAEGHWPGPDASIHEVRCHGPLTEFEPDYYDEFMDSFQPHPSNFQGDFGHRDFEQGTKSTMREDDPNESPNERGNRRWMKHRSLNGSQSSDCSPKFTGRTDGRNESYGRFSP